MIYIIVLSVIIMLKEFTKDKKRIIKIKKPTKPTDKTISIMFNVGLADDIGDLFFKRFKKDFFSTINIDDVKWKIKTGKVDGGTWKVYHLSREISMIEFEKLFRRFLVINNLIGRHLCSNIKKHSMWISISNGDLGKYTNSSTRLGVKWYVDISSKYLRIAIPIEDFVKLKDKHYILFFKNIFKLDLKFIENYVFDEFSEPESSEIRRLVNTSLGRN